MSNIKDLKEQGQVMAIFETPADYGGGVVLAQIDNGYVTWGFNADGHTYMGHYFTFPQSPESLNDQALKFHQRKEANKARIDFKERVATRVEGCRPGNWKMTQIPKASLGDIFGRLPPTVVLHSELDGPILVRRGEQGYHELDPLVDIDLANKAISEASGIAIDSAVKEAMRAGSMFGWHVLGADPEYYRGHATVEKADES